MIRHNWYVLSNAVFSVHQEDVPTIHCTMLTLVDNVTAKLELRYFITKVKAIFVILDISQRPTQKFNSIILYAQWQL